MKKVIPYVMLFFLLALYAYLSGCLIYRACFPADKLRYGVWRSENPDLVMDINPEVEGFGRVIYTQENGDVIELSAIFDYGNNLEIGKEHEGSFTGTYYTDTYFFGPYKIKGDKLTLTLTNQEFAKTDYMEIVFTKTKEYKVESQEEKDQQLGLLSNHSADLNVSSREG